MKYYIIINGSQAGPFTKEELLLQNLTPETLVWREGMADWAKALTVPELVDLMNFTTPPIHSTEPAVVAPVRPQVNAYNSQPEPPQNAFGQMTGMPVPHTNWMPWAIIATIVGFLSCCVSLIFGIIGIVNASKANGFYMQGYKEQGDSANSTARTMTIISFVISVISIIIICCYYATFLALLMI